MPDLVPAHNAPTPPWISSFEHREHPPGEQGVFTSLEEVRKHVNRGKIHPTVTSWVGEVLFQAGDPKGHVARAEALFNALKKQNVWKPDPRGVEMMSGAHLTLGDGKNPPPMRANDCFAEGTLLLAEGHRLIPIEKIEVGTRIWGLNSWVEVQKAWAKGPLPIDVVILNNGSQLRLTGDHHVNVLVCHRHTNRETSAPCSCPASERTPTKMCVKDLEPGMVLPSPERLPFGSDESLAPERAYLEGLFVADGWSSEEARFCISGKDGHPKEQQKREVEAICKKLGIPTRWDERYIVVKDAEWNQRMKQMGAKAYEKHLLSLNLGEAQAAETIRGVMADSGVNACGTRTLTSTSRLLAVQMRVLHKMFGITCGWQYIEDHGGLGKHPIWRLTTRKRDPGTDLDPACTPVRESGKSAKLLRVQAIERNVVEVPCYDITTEDHNVYLPEHDVTVLNCDDLTIAYLAACENAGIPTCIVGAAYDDGANISHVLGMVSDGKGSWYYADPSADWGFGQAKPTTREYIIDTLDGRVVCDGKSCTMSGRRPSPEGPGHFLSLNEGPHEPQVNTLGMVPMRSPGFLGAPGGIDAETAETLRDMVGTMGRYWQASLNLFNASNEALAAIGMPALGAPGLTGFGPADYQRMVDLKAMIGFGQDMLEQAIDGRRSVALIESANGWDIAIERLATDTVYLGWDGGKQRPQLYAIQGDQPIKSSGSVGVLPFVIAGVVATLGVCGAVAADAWSKAEQAKAATAAKIAQTEAELIKAGKEDQLVKVYNARRSLTAAEQQNGPGAQVAQALDSATRFLTLVGKAALILGAGWAAKKGYDYYKGRR